jgi:predicted phosphodiesterase
MIRKLLLSFALLPLLAGCDMFDSHPYDGQITGEKGINAKNIARIEAACAGKTSIKFVSMGDSQRWYDETEEFVNALNERDDIDFVIHAGDLTDFGATEEFMWMRDIMNGLDVPYVALLGNHDCLANGQDIFHTIFGPENFSFKAGDVNFICLNTNALEFDYSHPVPDFEFIENERDRQQPGQSKTVFAMHVRPYSEQFNNNIARVFQSVIKGFPNLQFCINGHDHHIQADDLFNDGVMYYGSASIEKKSYIVYTITPNNQYTYEVVYY